MSAAERRRLRSTPSDPSGASACAWVFLRCGIARTGVAAGLVGACGWAAEKTHDRITKIVVSASPTPALVVDRPYLFAIRERLSGTALFIGVVRDPRG